MRFVPQQTIGSAKTSHCSHQRQGIRWPHRMLPVSLIGLLGCGVQPSAEGEVSGLELAAADHVPACVSKSSEVALFGDSYINWVSHTFPQDLNDIAHANYRNYAVGGFAMATGGLGLIPDEIDPAFEEDPHILAAVVDGGGNDILVPDLFQFPDGLDCTTLPTAPTIPSCQKIVELAVDKAVEVMQRLAADGVTDVVYFFYPHVPEGTLIGGPHPNQLLDYALPKAKDACEKAILSTDRQLACHFVDMVPVFEGHPEYFADGDIHPNPTGSAAMAKAVWSKMQEECVGQPESSGCCEPDKSVRRRWPRLGI
jgi:hypothetical protein